MKKALFLGVGLLLATDSAHADYSWRRAELNFPDSITTVCEEFSSKCYQITYPPGSEDITGAKLIQKYFENQDLNVGIKYQSADNWLVIRSEPENSSDTSTDTLK